MDIPFILFRELSELFGTGEEENIRLSTTRLTYRFRRIEARHPLTEFSGAIGIHRKDDLCLFVLLSAYPRAAVLETIAEPSPLLVIRAAPQDQGTWAFGRGNLITEEIQAELPNGLYLQNKIAPLVALIIYRSTEIASNPSCISDRFWEAERHPRGSFTRP